MNSIKTKLEDRIKARYEPGSMRPVLCETITPNAPISKLKWMYYAGMGEIGFHDVLEAEERAARGLLEHGILVPTFERAHYNLFYRTLKHFDDVNFGMDDQGGILIFELADCSPDNPLPDLIIRPDEKLDAVIKRLKKRMSYGADIGKITIDESPLQLRGGPRIRPIVTDPNRVSILLRQREPIL